MVVPSEKGKPPAIGKLNGVLWLVLWFRKSNFENHSKHDTAGNRSGSQDGQGWSERSGVGCMGVDERVETGSLPFCKLVRMALSVVVAFSDLWVLRPNFTGKSEKK